MISLQSLTKQLPVPAFCNKRNSSSDGGWLAYQVANDEVRLVNYSNTISITQGFVFKFAPEPIKQIKVIADDKQNKVYMAITFLTKYVIYQGNTEICSYRLKLDKNIVVFENSFVGCDAVNDLKQIYFTFLTANGQIYVVSVDNIQAKSLVSLNSDQRLCSIKVLDRNVVMGSQNGKLFLVDLNKSVILKTFDTGSHMPILNLGWCNKRVIAITCQGQILSIAQNLTSFTAVSAHQGMVTQLNIHNNWIITFGDDCVLNVFQIENNSNDLKLKSSQKNNKRANLIVTLHGISLVNFYEDNTLTEIN